MDRAIRACYRRPMSDQFGIYIHIPFCIQRCHYCDFATYSKDQIEANDEYVEILCKEIKLRKNLFPHRNLDTIYFGGGTPSLLKPIQVEKILHSIEQDGFEFKSQIEITMEVNPATLDDQKAREMKSAGINRISIGCQTFNDAYLKACNREHSSQDTHETIDLAKKYFENFSVDLLFSLPQQGLSQLEQDLKIIETIDPPHVSPYCLTLTDGHPMNIGRCDEDEQIEMFDMIFQSMSRIGLKRYEISNFAKPGFESRHNILYWNDSDYWGVGLSAHSYSRQPGWGRRFWNPKTYSAYLNQIKNLGPTEDPFQSFSEGHCENLKKNESLTDFCHTHLRTDTGLSRSAVHQKFDKSALTLVTERMKALKTQKLIVQQDQNWCLSEDGILLSNQVFSELLFSASDIDNARGDLII